MALEIRSNGILTPSHHAFDADTSSDTYDDVPTHSTTGAAEQLLADIADLAPSIAARAAEIEAKRRMPPDLLEVLKEIGVFRALAPRSHSGLELDLLPAFEIMTALSQIDGSVGWCATIALGTSVILSLLPREMYDQIYAHGPDVVVAGSIQPAGTAEAVEGGWRVSGRWPFASGCDHADWIMGVCVMSRNGKPMPGPTDGVPLTRLLVLPAQYWQIEDTWHAIGLRGTGSHHVMLHDVLVSDAHFVDLSNGVPCIAGPLYQSPMHFIPLVHGPVAVGIAEAALNDIVAMAGTNRRQLYAAKPMRETELFQAELGRAQAELRAAKAYLEIQTASHWRHACAGTLRNDGLMIEGTQAAIWVTQACLRVAETCFALGGGSAVYDASPLQRRLRDLQAAAQHAAVQQRHYVDAGKRLLTGFSGG
jgi:indole-3-acetate monooxygenase